MKFLNLGLLMLTLSFLSAQSGWAESLSRDEIRESIQETLKIRHPVQDPDWWRSLGAEASKIIQEMYNEKRPISEKIRLIEALALFEDPDTGVFLKNVYRDQPNRVAKEAAVRSIAASQGSKEKAFLENVLAKSNTNLKIRIAKSLDSSRQPGSARLVDDILKKENNSQIASSIRQHRDQVRAKLKNKPSR